MNEKLQFILGLKDEWSGKIGKAMEASEEFNFSINQLKKQLEAVESVKAGTKIAYEFDIASEASNDLKQRISQLENGIRVDFDKSGRSVNDLRQQIQKLSHARDLLPKDEITKIRQHNDELKKLTREVSKLQKATGSSKIRGWFEDAFNSIPFANLLKNPLVVAGSVASQALSIGMQRDLDKTAFSVMLNSEEAAEQLITDLKGVKMDQSALSDAAKQMLSFGVAQEKVLPMLDAIGNIAGGDAQKVSGLTLAFSQMTSTGKLMGQDLLQMINAGFNPLAEISRTTGKSMSELKDEMAKGNITVEMVEDAYKSATSEGGTFNGMLDKMNNTLRGKLNQAMQRTNEILLQLYSVIEPIVSVSLDAFIGVTAMASDIVMWFVEGLKELNPVLTTFGIILGSLAVGMATYVVATKIQVLWSQRQIAIQKMQTIWNNITSASWWKLNAAMLASPVTWVTTLVVGLIAVIAYLIEKVDGWGEAWSHTVNGSKLIFEAWTESVKFRFNTVVNGIMIGINKIKEGWYSFSNTIGLGDKAENNAALDAIKADTEARMAEIEEGTKRVKDLALQSGKEFLKAGGSLSLNDKSLSDVINGYKAKLGIADPKVPGVVNENNEKELEKELGKSNETIATGGQKNTTINIDFKNFVETLNIQGKSFKESAGQMQENLEDAFLRVLAMANTTAG